MLKQRWLANTGKRKIALDLISDDGVVKFRIHTPGSKDDPSAGTIRLGAMRCPVCSQGVYDKAQIKNAAKKFGLGLMPVCVVSSHPTTGRRYELFERNDLQAFDNAKRLWQDMLTKASDGVSEIPDEDVSRDFEWVLKPPMFGLTKWRDQHNPRQAVALAAFAANVRLISSYLHGDYGVAVSSFLALVLGRLADKAAIQCVWNAPGEKLEHVFGRQAIPMSWDYGELNPFSGAMGDWLAHLDWVVRATVECSKLTSPAQVRRGSATKLPLESGQMHVVVTDPPYYDAVPYSD